MLKKLRFLKLSFFALAFITDLFLDIQDDNKGQETLEPSPVSQIMQISGHKKKVVLTYVKEKEDSTS